MIAEILRVNDLAVGLHVSCWSGIQLIGCFSGKSRGMFTHVKCYRYEQDQINIGLNIFYSAIEYTEKDWVRPKVGHYSVQICNIL